MGAGIRALWVWNSFILPNGPYKCKNFDICKRGYHKRLKRLAMLGKDSCRRKYRNATILCELCHLTEKKKKREAVTKKPEKNRDRRKFASSS